MIGKHTIRTYSSTQTTVSLSSGEAEYYGLVKGAAAGLGQQAIMSDYGVDLPVRLWSDSSAQSYNDSAGWAAFSSDIAGDGPTLAMVYGFDKTPQPSFQTGASSWRSGYANGLLAGQRPSAASALEWRNYLAASARRLFTVAPGEGRPPAGDSAP